MQQVRSFRINAVLFFFLMLSYLGRNGGHLIPNAFSAFNTRKTKYNTTEAVKSYMIEQYTADALLRYLKERNLEDVVDLSERGHVMLFATQDEELAERQDFAAASKAGLDLNSVRWIDNREFVEVGSSFFPPSFTSRLFFFLPRNMV